MANGTGVERRERGEVASVTGRTRGRGYVGLARLARERDITWGGDDHLESDLDDL